MASRPGGIIPISNFCEPPEGRRALQYEIDLSAGVADIDLTDVTMQKQLSKVQTIYFDNGDNSFEIHMSFDGTRQRITFAPYTQGYINLLLPNSPKIRFTSAFQTVLKVSFLNFIVPETTWTTEAQGMGIVSVSLSLPLSEFNIVTPTVIPPGGTLTAVWNGQPQNTVFAGPVGVPSAIPTFRALVAADIPVLPYAPLTLSTMTVITASGNYSPSANCRQIKIRMIGAGGGGAGSGTGTGGNGGNGTNTSFNGIVAAPGQGGTGITALGGIGGTGGSGAANFRAPGNPGNSGFQITTVPAFTNAIIGPSGASSQFGGGGRGGPAAGGNAPNNTGCGGAGAGMGQAGGSGGSGGNGEYVELTIDNPVGPYAVVIGTGGAAGTAGASGFVGGIGGSGLIIVEETY